MNSEILGINKIFSERIVGKLGKLVAKESEKKDFPIGIFDSGVGGLSVLSEVLRQLPSEDIIYLADTARIPYGGRPPEEIININTRILDFFLKQNVKMVIMACGTSSAIAYPVLKDKYPFPIVSLIEPGSKTAVSKTNNLKIGVIATQGTVRSNAYPKEIVSINGDIKVFQEPCPLFVPLIEEGFWYGQMAESIVRYYLEDSNSGFDKIILGCTHYPILKKHIIKNITAEIVDPADGIIKELGTSYNLKHSSGLPKINFYITGDVEKFKVLSGRFLRTVYFRGYYFKMDLETKKYYYFR